MIRILSILILIIFGSEIILAQVTSVGFNDYKEENKSFTGWQEYSGFFDQTHSFDLLLGYRNDKVHGKYSFPGTDLEFELDGHVKGDSVLCIEIDDQLAVSGILKLKRVNSTLKGIWLSKDKTRSIPMSMFLQSSVDSDPTPNTQSWVRLYEGHIDHKPSNIILSKSGISDVLGIIDLNKEEYLFFQGKHIYLPSEALNAILMDGKNSYTGRITLNMGIKNVASLAFKREAESTRYSQFYLMEEWPASITTQMHYFGSSEFHFVQPKDVNNTFEIFQNNLHSRFEEKMDSVFNFAKTNEWEHLSEYRMQQTAYAWYEFDLVTSLALSGYWVFQFPDGEFEYYPFLYDRKNNLFLDLHDQFKRRYSLISIIGRHFPERVKDGIITLAKGGLIIHEPFDEERGNLYYFLPYRDFASSLKRNSLIKTIMH
jgi:hypothetical protein